ncbi:carboxylesterase family protein [Mycobacterium sp. TNTM28]|uniref:Carboxylesterase family protein n=1 Tax=[Mycobacterium] fortunisiensis TaxID=2600579 RepID=A0ABS6KU36_9MYCO|nr:carboxylesterase family protein [[Mycobacterium] fortunisiensis]MBU9767075.1 carboxylesterase family protein [[Mycobacterium] fortunisiensis]
MIHRHVHGGTIQVDESDGLIRARGVPYGRAKRFEIAEPVGLWPGVRDATQPGAACPQRPSRLSFVTGPILDGLATSEDCLLVTVTAPVNAHKLPVMVWFHGGAYVSGSGESPKYDAGLLAREGDVVVVNVSYRLGIFGFLTPVGEENLGLRDQLLALNWVSDNIAAFGGDPDNVTAFGQSAGADSVLKLMLCDASAGLFHRAILQSGPLELNDGRDRLADAMRRAMDAALAGVPPAEATITQLLHAEAAAIQAAQGFGLLGALAFAPILGRAPLPPEEAVLDRIAQAAKNIELLIGYTKDDGAPFVAMDRRVTALGRVPALGRLVTKAGTPALTRKAFGGPAERLAQAWRDNGGQVGEYRIDWAPQGAPLGATHCIELPLLFGSPQIWSDAPMLGPQHTIDDHLARELRTRWTQFAHHGTASLPEPKLRFG